VEHKRWQRLKDVFNRALELDPEMRAAFLDETCAGDSELRAEVESLLHSHQDADDFMEQPACESAPELPADDQSDRFLGCRLGPYLVERKLGEGGMGVVYLAEDTRLGRAVAIKVLSPEHSSDARHRERLKREARVAATLAHPAIATVFALEEHEGDLFIVSEYVRGHTLLEELTAGPLAISVLLEICVEVARALSAAHAHGVIHRDLKPENVIRTPEGAIKILDFGLARFQTGRHINTTNTTRLTGAGTFLGTPAYASPEQLLGLEVDFRSDIFSFGVMLYELATGIHPFAAPDSITTIARILEAEPSPLTRFRPILPAELDQIARRCLHKTPGARYSSSHGLVADLEKLQKRLDEMQAQQQPIPNPDVAAPGRLHPKWWWQFHQAVIGFLYYAMLYPMWKVKQTTPGGWGALLFFMCVAAVAVAANLRFHLWFTSGFYAAELADQRRHVAGLVRGADILFVSLLLMGAVAIHGVSTPYTTLLIAVAVGSLCAFLLIEPTTTRAAFGTRG